AGLEKLLFHDGRRFGEAAEGAVDAFESAGLGGLAPDVGSGLLAEVVGGGGEGGLEAGGVVGMAHRGEGGKDDSGVLEEGLEPAVADRLGRLAVEPGVEMPGDDAQEHELKEVDAAVAGDEA